MAKKNISRKQFLRGDYRGRRTVMRPPWALPEDDFVDQCTRCGDCLKACPEKIISVGLGGFPEVDFSKGECTFCQECHKACTASAFRPLAQRPWLYHIEFNERCLSRNGVICVTCAEQCETEAIHFVHRVGSVPHPQISASLCTACGACYRPCPVGAIQFKKTQTLTNKQPSQRLEAYP